MADEQWDRLKQLFHQAVDCAASERARFVAQNCGSDNVLRQRLETLLASHEQFPDFMEVHPVPEASALTISGPILDDGSLERGTLLDGKYRIERCIGAGGMGVVYQVLHTGLGRGFAAKVIHGSASEDPRFLHRFRVEAQALGSLQHPNILNVTDFGVDPERNVPYLITEYLEGETLSDRLKSSGPLPVNVALPLFDAMGAAIDHAHRYGILHLDLKPANVFLTKRDGLDQVKILDFGLAHVMRNDVIPDPAEEPLHLGTPAYLAPELAQGQTPVTASDIYAFGVLAYEVLTGRRPFEGSVGELLRSHVRDQPVAPSRVQALLPSELDAPLLSPLQKDPAARPATAGEVVGRIREASLTAALRKWRQDEIPRRAIWAVCLGLVALLVFPGISALDVIERIEGQSLDARFAMLAKRPPDPSILLLMIDDETLLADSTPLTSQGNRVGTQLQRVFEAGARGIGIDLLLHETWGRSEGFSQLVLRHADSLTLAAFTTPSGTVIGPECIAGATTVALGAERAAALFGFVNSSSDQDGVHRRAQLEYRADDGRARPSWAARVASMGRAASTHQPVGRFLIDRSVDWHQLERVSWKDLTNEVSERPGRFRDRLVLVGGTFDGSGDEVRLSSRTEALVPGLFLHALAVDSILSGFRVRDVRGWPLMIGVFLGAAAVTAAVLCVVRLTRAFLLVLFVSLSYGAVALLMFVMNQIVVPVAAPLATLAAGAALALVIRLVARTVPSSRTTRHRPPAMKPDDRTRLVSA